jgi:alanine-glyoxylate transaminase/serine-glyoxylate transaminase/serine-pyruvate transaminase
MLTTVQYPGGVDDAAFRRRLREMHRIEVGAGLGPLAGRVFRIGTMGHGATLRNVERVVAAIGEALAAQGVRVDPAAALLAARRA